MEAERLSTSRLYSTAGTERLHLTALDAEIVSGHGVGKLACGVVSRRGSPLLNVIRIGDPSRSIEVGCSRVGGVWWFVVQATGEGITPVDEVAQAPIVLLGLLERKAKE